MLLRLLMCKCLKFLDTQKDVSDKTKEYLLAVVAAQYDLREPANPKLQEVFKFLDTKIKKFCN